MDLDQAYELFADPCDGHPFRSGDDSFLDGTARDRLRTAVDGMKALALLVEAVLEEAHQTLDRCSDTVYSGLSGYGPTETERQDGMDFTDRELATLESALHALDDQYASDEDTPGSIRRLLDRIEGELWTRKQTQVSPSFDVRYLWQGERFVANVNPLSHATAVELATRLRRDGWRGVELAGVVPAVSV